MLIFADFVVALDFLGLRLGQRSLFIFSDKIGYLRLCTLLVVCLDCGNVCV